MRKMMVVLRRFNRSSKRRDVWKVAYSRMNQRWGIPGPGWMTVRKVQKKKRIKKRQESLDQGSDREQYQAGKARFGGQSVGRVLQRTSSSIATKSDGLRAKKKNGMDS
ncbi:uncharacterized protein CIMG_12275 [Coccidioides immitis RS]|uniref:Uncharacterized protein n=1 Tax=Coccidioides immitis (strain RS) TaxID=246410 RepID=A0A0D8JVI0_COCIM|nr:uncharacterized protein CIMG_12275 [Coccidioides immitis RS]KJF61317.1 hypothetical protein CIMG_12275 [Coccidioides immitis RS]